VAVVAAAVVVAVVEECTGCLCTPHRQASWRTWDHSAQSEVQAVVAAARRVNLADRPGMPHRQAWWRIGDQPGWSEGPANMGRPGTRRMSAFADIWDRSDWWEIRQAAAEEAGRLKRNRRNERADEGGHCIRWNGRTRRGYHRKCPGHSDFRRHVANTRGYGPAHLLLPSNVNDAAAY
jgi:hypothetical protein